MNKACLFLICSFTTLTLHAQKKPQLGKNSVKEVVKSMTTEEKARLLFGMGFKVDGLPPEMPKTNPEDQKATVKVPNVSGYTHEFPQYNIPTITMADGPAGVHIWVPPTNGTKIDATSFPVGTLLSATWDTELVQKVGKTMGAEAKEFGIDFLLAPAMNIQRDPLNGRNYEYYSEDPVLSGSIASAMVKGIQSVGVGVALKHFIADNTETNALKLNAIMSERTLREIYLRGFQIAIKDSKPWSIMSSYNKVNGPYTSQNKELLTTILRDEWNYKGFVMSDWYSGDNAVTQINSGNNLIMPGTYMQEKAIMEAAKNGTISPVHLNDMAEQILNIVTLTPTFLKYAYSNHPDLKSGAILSRQAAADGMVLLKNDGNSLPFNKIKKAALFGNSSYQIFAGGTGSGDVQREYTVSLVDGLQNVGIQVLEPVANQYKAYLAKENEKAPKTTLEAMMRAFYIQEMPLSDNTFAEAANAADVAIISIGRMAGEGKDRKIENDFDLTADEQSNLKKLSEAFHAKDKKLIVVINSAGVIETASWKGLVDGILLAWQPGMEGGNAITDILTGKVNPSGKLPITFPAKYSDAPTAKNFPGKVIDASGKKPTSMVDSAQPSEIVYEEGIYVGYRYYSTFHVEPSFEFGYGLSYSPFKYGDVKLNSPSFSDKLTATVTVTNTGKIPGKEVVELYLNVPSGSLDKPEIELKKFAKTSLLQPGQSQTVSFTLTPMDLASFNTASSSWIADAGKYTVKIGSSCKEIKTTADFNLAKNRVIEKVHKVMVPQVTINELNRK